MDKKLKILILEDSPDDVDLIERELKRGGIDFTAVVVDNKNGFENAVREFIPDVVLSDHSLPEFNSIEALRLFKQHQKESGISAPFILVTGSVSEEFAVQSIKAGADDYILKDRLKRLPVSIQNAIEKCKIENEKHRAEVEKREIFEILQKSLNEIYIFNAETLLFEYVNEGALKNIGYSREEMTRLTPLDIQPEFTEESFRTLLAGVKEIDTQAKSFETLNLRKDRTIYNAEVHLQLMAQGKRKTFLAIVIDITERKKHLWAIENQNEKLMEIARIQSHEVRGPLARMMGLISLIHEYEDKEIDLEYILKNILRSANELDVIIRKIVRKTEDIDK
jgi:PAS domain S-box-containing protein